MTKQGAQILAGPHLAARGRIIVRGVWLYDWLQPLVMFGQERALHRRIAQLADPQPSERVLDVGCGTGALTAEIARAAPECSVFGIDASGPMVAAARRKHAGCRFDLAPAESLPFEDASFDCVVSSLFFHHVPRDLKASAAREIVRVLRPGGRAAVADIGRPWNLFGWLYAAGGWIVLRQPEIKENMDGMVPIVLADAGLTLDSPRRAGLGCISLWHGRKGRA